MTQDTKQLLRSLSDVMFPSAPDTPVQIDSVGYDGDTPLHLVAWRNDLEAVRLLIDAGADVNARGEMDETPLHIAVHHGNVQMVQVLLRAGARADIRSEFGDTPKERASLQGGQVAALFGIR
jgi:ankyrin repeat protein